MKLNLLERILAVQSVIVYEQAHQFGNFITLKAVARLKEILPVTEEETKKYELRVEDGDYKWNELGFTEYVDFNLSEFETNVIKEGLLELDKTERLTSAHFSLYEKFIPIEEIKTE